MNKKKDRQIDDNNDDAYNHYDDSDEDEVLIHLIPQYDKYSPSRVLMDEFASTSCLRRSALI